MDIPIENDYEYDNELTLKQQQKYDYSNYFVNVEVKQDGHGGLGVFLKQHVKVGTPLLNVCCVSKEAQLKNHYPLENISELPPIALSHAIQVDADHVCIDPSELIGCDRDCDCDCDRKEEESSMLLAINYLNHHCDPSAWFCPGTFILESRRELEQGDEITFDYATVDHLPALLDMPCSCDYTYCRKHIIGSISNSRDAAIKYDMHVSKYLLSLLS